MSEKRKIVRHSFDEDVILDVEGQVLSGRTLDISQDGIKVVVTMPDSFREVHQLAVSLPGSQNIRSLPCSIRRSDIEENDNGEWVLGLSFDFETESQILLIEKYLDDRAQRYVKHDGVPSESRQLPRTDCQINEVSTGLTDIVVHSIDNISTDGFLISFSGELRPGSMIPMKFRIPDGGDPIEVEVDAVYIIKNGMGNIDNAGMTISEIAESDRNRLRNYIVDSTSSAAIREFHNRLTTHKPNEEFRIDDPQEINAILDVLISQCLKVNILTNSSLKIIEARITERNNKVFTVDRSSEDGSDTTNSSGGAYFSFTLENASYFFSTDEESQVGSSFVYDLPEIIYRAEKRSSGRKEADSIVEMTLDLDGFSSSLRGQMLDRSRRGFLCEIPLDDIEGDLPISGQPLAYVVKKGTGSDGTGEVRHTRTSIGEDGKPVLRVGIETGISRKDPRFERHEESTWLSSLNCEVYPVGEAEYLYPRPISYKDTEGRTIRALLHTTGIKRPSVVIVLPPAYGKKKETLAPLALTLLVYFLKAGENISIIRYDGIDRPGESHNDNPYARRGYEMLDYRIEQGHRDLLVTLDWIRSTDLLEPAKIAVISASMSSLDIRYILTASDPPNIDYWISLMGIPSAQNAYRTILGGLDIIGNRRMGISNGMMGLLGHLMDMDKLADDLLDLGFANVSDARDHLSRIAVPVTWIYGAYDKWITPEEIRDIMSVEAPSDREIVEIPTGHNLRTSDEAAVAFKLIAEKLIGTLTEKDIPNVKTDKREMLNLISWERERLPEHEILDIKRYWKSYLVGDDRIGEGYDFYRRLREFRGFLQDETAILDPRPGEAIADLGCGTGLLTENLLVHLDEHGMDLDGTSLVAVDLVPEALAKVREKVGILKRARPNLADVDFEWMPINLEPDKLGSLRRFVDGSVETLEELDGNLPDVSNAKLAKWAETIPEETSALLRGVVPPPDLEPYRNVYLTEEDIAKLRDLGKAARFLAKTTLIEDVIPQRRGLLKGSTRDEALRALRTSDLLLEVLDLGDRDRWGDSPLGEVAFDKIAASLLLSYLGDPLEAVNAFYRMLKPGGRLLVSSMRPDSDISGIFTAYINEQAGLDRCYDDEDRERNLKEARQMLNEAASLFELEEDGYFRFFGREELLDIFTQAGFTSIKVSLSMGNPAQAVVISGKKP